MTRGNPRGGEKGGGINAVDGGLGGIKSTTKKGKPQHHSVLPPGHSVVRFTTQPPSGIGTSVCTEVADCPQHRVTLKSVRVTNDVSARQNVRVDPVEWTPSG